MLHILACPPRRVAPAVHHRGPVVTAVRVDRLCRPWSDRIMVLCAMTPAPPPSIPSHTAAPSPSCPPPPPARPSAAGTHPVQDCLSAVLPLSFYLRQRLSLWSCRRHTKILHNLFREIGVWEKQSSAFFQAKAAQSFLKGNVVFNLARAGFNFNGN
eukprot:SAG22_NODE_237_length_14221_cov_37.207832_11_plen_156_part_00